MVTLKELKVLRSLIPKVDYVFGWSFSLIM